jgi:hypothetical protein
LLSPPGPVVTEMKNSVLCDVVPCSLAKVI